MMNKLLGKRHNSSQHRRQLLQAFIWGDGEYGQLGLGDKR